jgi:DNA-binding response OmpR family regulator
MSVNQISPEIESSSVRMPWERALPKRILLVDNEPMIRQLYTEALADFGYIADGAEDGAVAWEALQKNSYDLLITENIMPNVSGIELLKLLRTARIGLPVIMAAASFPGDVFISHPHLQPDVTLLKPYTMAEFLETVKEVLNVNLRVRPSTMPLPAWQIRPTIDRLRP